MHRLFKKNYKQSSSSSSCLNPSSSMLVRMEINSSKLHSQPGLLSPQGIPYTAKHPLHSCRAWKGSIILDKKFHPRLSVVAEKMCLLKELLWAAASRSRFLLIHIWVHLPSSHWILIQEDIRFIILLLLHRHEVGAAILLPCVADNIFQFRHDPACPWSPVPCLAPLSSTRRGSMHK